MQKQTTQLMLASILLFMSHNIYAASDDWLSKLGSTDPQERAAAAQAIVAARNDQILKIESVLQEIVDNPERKGSAASMIILLGDLRSEHSIQLLIKHLTFSAFYKDVKRPQPMSDLYPVSGALIKIGMPAVDPILDSASNTDDELHLRIAGFVLRKVLGADLVKAKINIQLDKALTERSRQRFAKLLAFTVDH